MEIRETVIKKLTVYVATDFDGDWKKAFDAYATDGKISKPVLEAVFQKAGIGTVIGRAFITNYALNIFDANSDGCISWEEFQAIAHVVPPAPPKP